MRIEPLFNTGISFEDRGRSIYWYNMEVFKIYVGLHDGKTWILEKMAKETKIPRTAIYMAIQKVNEIDPVLFSMGMKLRNELLQSEKL